MAYMMSKRQAWGPVCPAGGKWYACGYGTFFVGCCDNAEEDDPCSTTCSQGNLRPAGYNPDSGVKFPDASCGAGSDFYRCAAGVTFLGCCKSDPCKQKGCPDGSLEPAFVNRDDQKVSYQVTGASSSATATATSTQTPISNGGKPNIAIIAGAAGGGVLILAIIIALVVFCMCRRKKAKKGHADQRHSFIPAEKAERDKLVSSPEGSSQWPTPNPDSYSQDGFQQHKYAHHHQQTPQYDSVPQEMPAEPLSPSKLVSGPFGHRRGASELSSTMAPSELETPVGSPNPQAVSPHRSPALQSLPGFQNPSAIQSRGAAQHRVAELDSGA